MVGRQNWRGHLQEGCGSDGGLMPTTVGVALGCTGNRRDGERERYRRSSIAGVQCTRRKT